MVRFHFVSDPSTQNTRTLRCAVRFPIHQRACCTDDTCSSLPPLGLKQREGGLELALFEVADGADAADIIEASVGRLSPHR